MIPIRDNQLHRYTPLVTWTLIALNVLIFVWDRQGNLFGNSIVFGDLAMRPKMVLAAIRQPMQDSFPLVTVFTSMFMHGNLMHLIGNMVFLLVFGYGVENALGPIRFALYYLAWGVLAAAAHIYVGPDSTIPTLGASGAIGGVLGCYLLLFPGNKIEMIVPPLFFLPFVVSAWILLGLWFAFQIFLPQEGVANWAHAGGFLAGMLTVLVVGGRAAVLKNKEPLQTIDLEA
jgi:membrane associated rhomboid family serine protease